MAAPIDIIWGDIVGNGGRIGIHVGLSNTDTTTTATFEVWFWSQYSVSDDNESFWFGTNTTSKYPNKEIFPKISIRHTDDSGWSTNNQTKIYTYVTSYNRTENDQTIYCSATLSSIEDIDAAMRCVRSYVIPGISGYTVSYDANGGSGEPLAQTKAYDVPLILSNTVPIRTGYSFKGWGTSPSSTIVEYSPGESYTANASITLYAIWEAAVYIVTYDANGGTGAEAFQEKIHDVALTLSSAIPTRTGYSFKGWGTSPSSTTVAYSPGSSYTANASITLYAIWEIVYSKPRITNVIVARCDSDGNFSEEGTYFNLSFSWATTLDVSSITVNWKLTTAADVWAHSTISATGTSGTATGVFGNGSIEIDSSYNVKIIVTDTKDSNYLTKTIPARCYPIDVLSGGTGVAFGKPAELADYIDSNFKAKFRKDVAIDSKIYDKFNTEFQNGLCAYTGSGESGIDANTTLEHLILTDLNTPNRDLMYIKTEFYNSKTSTSNRMQTAFPYKDSNFSYFRYYYNGEWSNWKQSNIGWYSGSLLFTDMPFSGYISDSNKVVLCTIPIGRPLYTNHITATGSLIIRGVRGYLGQATWDAPLTIGASGYTFEFNIDQSQAASGFIGYKITRSSAFSNATNNTPVSICTHPDNPFMLHFG